TALHRVELEANLAVPVEPEPAQRALDLLDRLGHLAARVRVLDPKQDLASVLPGEEPVEEEGPHAADVEEAGGRRSHADADGHRRTMVDACGSGATSRRPAGSTRRSTGPRRSAARRCRSSRRARACGGRRTTT